MSKERDMFNMNYLLYIYVNTSYYPIHKYKFHVYLPVTNIFKFKNSIKLKKK